MFASTSVEMTGAAFSPGGDTIVISDITGNVQVYSCDVCAANTVDLLRIAETRRTRQFTPSERHRFLEPE
jgi:hypothetical protein